MSPHLASGSFELVDTRFMCFSSGKRLNWALLGQCKASTPCHDPSQACPLCVQDQGVRIKEQLEVISLLPLLQTPGHELLKIIRQLMLSTLLFSKEVVASMVEHINTHACLEHDVQSSPANSCHSKRQHFITWLQCT